MNSSINNQNSNEITPPQNDTDSDFLFALLIQKEELESNGYLMRPQDMAFLERQTNTNTNNTNNTNNNNNSSNNNNNTNNNSNNNNTNNSSNSDDNNNTENDNNNISDNSSSDDSNNTENDNNNINDNSSSDDSNNTENDEAIALQLQKDYYLDSLKDPGYNFLGNPGYNLLENPDYSSNIDIKEYHKNEIQQMYEKNVEEKISYEYFKNKLRSKEAHPLKVLIQEFFRDFEQKTKYIFTSPEEQSQYLRSNLNRICNLLIENPLWANCEMREKENAIVHMEKIVTKKLFNITFAPQKDLERDDSLSEIIFKHSWVEPKHLDLPDFDSRIFEKAGNELEKMNLFKYYVDKISCIVNCSKFIEDAYNQNLSDKETFSIDKLLPLMIFVILKSNPKKLISNVNYIDRYINRSFLNIEVYNISLTNIKLAILFIEKLSQESLRITPKEYKAKIIEMNKKASEKLKEPSIETTLFDGINTDNNFGSFIHSLHSIGSSIGSTIKSTLW